MLKEKLRNREIDLTKTTKVLKERGVSFDIDGVEVASAVLSIREYNILYGMKIGNPKVLDDVKDYGIMLDWIGADPGVKNPQKAAESIWNNRETLETARPVRGVRAVLTYLLRHKHSVVPYRITSRPGHTRESTEKWFLNQYGRDFDLDLIRMQNEGETSISPDFKAGEIKRLGIGFHFEDSYENAEKIIEINPETVVVLVPQPWNADYNPKVSNIVKVDGYSNRMKVVRSFLTLAEKITFEY